VNKVADQKTSVPTKVNKVLKWQLLTAAGAMTLLAGADCHGRLSHQRINLAGADCKESRPFESSNGPLQLAALIQTLLTLSTLVAKGISLRFNLIHLIFRGRS
jgi:hypothetical protein